MIKRDNLFSAGGMTQSERYLHTPGKFAKQNLLYVQEVGRLKSLKPHRCVRDNLESYLFLVVLEGKGSLDIEGQHYEIKAGDCALIDCVRHYEHISDELDAWKLAWVHFNGFTAKGYYELFMKHNGDKNIFTVSETKQWNTAIGELMERQKDKKLQAELECGELLLSLLNQIIDNVSNASIIEGEREQQIANELREQLNEQYADKDILNALVEYFKEDINVLEDIFFRRFGIGIEEYISNRRFNAAKEMLRFSIKSVEDVAEESGIGDTTVMQNMFRENEGMSAEGYRMKWAQWIR